MMYKGCNIQYRIVVFLFMVVLVFITDVHGQKEPQYTQYMYNIGSFNSAYVGTVETPEVIGLYRAQWLDIEGAPRTIRFGVNLPFKNKKTGLGFNIVNDQIGPTTQTFFSLAYSYQIKLSDNTNLSFGIDAGGAQLNVDYSKGLFQNPELLANDETINKFYPTVGAGTFLYTDNWYLGLSTPNFIGSINTDEDIVRFIDDRIQLNVIGGYVFELSENLKFKPAFLINYLSASPLNIDLSTNFLISDVFTIGASYRWDNAVSSLAGFQIGKGVFAGYSYDYNTNGLGEFNNGSHEVILKFYLGNGSGKTKSNKSKNKKTKAKQIDSPRFF